MLAHSTKKAKSNVKEDESSLDVIIQDILEEEVSLGNALEEQ